MLKSIASRKRGGFLAATSCAGMPRLRTGANSHGVVLDMGPRMYTMCGAGPTLRGTGVLKKERDRWDGASERGRMRSLAEKDGRTERCRGVAGFLRGQVMSVSSQPIPNLTRSSTRLRSTEITGRGILRLNPD